MDIIKIPFGFLLEKLYLFCNNYGVALILFSLIVKLILLPMGMKSKKSMMKMSRLQPQLKQLEIACGDDKQKYQQETMRLYKEENVSMFGGCLWSLIPLLILFPLYTVIREPLTYMLHLKGADYDAIKAAFVALGNSTKGAYWQFGAAQIVETCAGAVKEGAEFLKDIDFSSIHLDKLAALKDINFSFLGIDLGQKPVIDFWKDLRWSTIGGTLIPIVSGAFSYLSMFISQKMNDSVIRNENGEADPTAQASAQTGKTMTRMMPLVSVIFGFMMPLGISIYWISQSVFGIVQDYFLTKHYRKVYDAEDAVRREKAAQRATEEAEKERIRAAKRAANPDGITENTSKKKQQLRERQEREAAAKEFHKKHADADTEQSSGGEPDRPYARGRAYQSDHYGKKE